MTDATLTPASKSPETAHAAMRRIITAAWLAVIAGVTAQILVIAVRVWSGGAVDGFFAEMAQGLTWSTLVCIAIAIGTLASKAREHIAGLIGFLAGPLAWAAAKGVQKGVQALANAPQDQLTPLFWSVCAVKGVEYAVLGAGLASIVRRNDQALRHFLSFGALLGALAACVVIALHVANADLSGAAVPRFKIASLAANEIFFTCGCCTVIYAAQALTRHVAVLRGG